MHETNVSGGLPLSGMDLNLLRVLDALLQTHSVTEAGRTLGLTQPAVSHSLRKLREHLGDPILVREGRGMVPTPRAEAMAPVLRALLADLGRILSAGAQFDPKTAQRSFGLACPDTIAPALPSLLQALSDAPGVKLALHVGTHVSAVSAVDLTLGVMPEQAPGVMVRRLGDIRQAVALRKGHPALALPWTPETYVRWPHILVRTPGGPSPVGAAVEALGLQREVGLVLPTFLLAAHLAAGSDMLFTSAEPLLRQVAEPLGLVILEPPLALPIVPAAAMWSERLNADAGHQWFRGRVIQVVQQLLEP